MKMILPKLNNLTPTTETTFKKIVEEVSECKEAMTILTNYEKEKSIISVFNYSDADLKVVRKRYKELIEDVLGEIVDVAQTCATQFFIFKEDDKFSDDILLKNKYCPTGDTHGDEDDLYIEEYEALIKFNTEDNLDYLYVNKPNKTSIHNIDDIFSIYLQGIGKIASLGKFLGENGEEIKIKDEDATKAYIFHLGEMIIASYHFIYLLKEKYNLTIDNLFDKHIKKLRKRNYLK